SGYFPEGAATSAKNIVQWSGGDPGAATLKALKDATPYLTVPLAVGSGIAGTISDFHQGASPADAIVGNIVRGGLVYGAGAGVGELTGGLGAIPASMAADHYLPPAPAIGHAIVQAILNPPSLPDLYAAYDPASLEAFGQ
ncbi:MAG TPA: hypothetical protein VMU31_06845, partial [Rhizomicrobium sp.]|nr:hypothetical protein [Rhizomicrobium sp.]